MIIKFTPHKSNPTNPMKAIKGGVRYVQDEKDWQHNERSEKPEELIGNGDDFLKKISNAGKHSGKYTHAIISFTERQLSKDFVRDRVNEVIDGLMPGLDTARVPVYANMHRDKENTLHVHLFVAGVDLPTGNRFNAYFVGKDFRRIDCLQNMINAKHGLSDPKDPAFRRLIDTDRKKWPIGQKLVTEIDEHIKDQIVNGKIKSKQDVINELKEIGLEVNRVTAKRISIKNPARKSEENARPIALKGPVFEDGFDFESALHELRKSKEEQSAEFKATAEQRYLENKKLYDELYTARIETNDKRYRIKPKRLRKGRSLYVGSGIVPRLGGYDGIRERATADHFDTTLRNLDVRSMFRNPATRWRVPMQARKFLENNEKKEQLNGTGKANNQDVQDISKSVDRITGQVDEQNERIDKCISRQRGSDGCRFEQARQRLTADSSTGERYEGISEQLSQVDQFIADYQEMMARQNKKSDWRPSL
ncbi:relaxase/mobilization nuclease domain-containing protein [Salinicola rhizosphaerae]|uniref:MobA/VirD2-like nuclease domain-containing protein n=1 Tax=Salinicola rhizosphaerae TaxID=1443141 RepID=A0ABQ3DWJ9_9GAMM|nr:relaxase/mobilization nuclease domain-containing protein [Salinicola rhizosphaerae]GHB12939.1 hypothetical protein GCM10009038_08730 [Salinicola rhizosphaerae]